MMIDLITRNLVLLSQKEQIHSMSMVCCEDSIFLCGSNIFLFMNVLTYICLCYSLMVFNYISLSIAEKFRFSAEFIEMRHRALDVFLNRIASHHELRRSEDLRTFLQVDEEVYIKLFSSSTWVTYFFAVVLIRFLKHQII